MNIHQSIETLLENSKNDYITISKLRAGLPIASIKALGLKRSTSSIRQVVESITPHLDNTFRVLHKGNKYYIGYNLSAKQIVLNKIRRTPNISFGRLRHSLPLHRVELIEVINNLLAESEIYAQISNNTNAIPKFRISSAQSNVDSLISKENDILLFKRAFKKVGKGKSFVRIHLIRDYLGWEKNRFDIILRELCASHSIQLHQGNPNDYSDAELEKSYLDKKGKLRLTLTWVSNE